MGQLYLKFDEEEFEENSGESFKELAERYINGEMEFTHFY